MNGRPLGIGAIMYPLQGYTGYGDSVGTDLRAFIDDEMHADWADNRDEGFKASRPRPATGGFGADGCELLPRRRGDMNVTRRKTRLAQFDCRSCMF
jgi:hypothetical protein